MESRGDLVAVRQHVEPAPLPLGVSLVPAHKVSLTHDPDDGAGRVDHRHAADVALHHQLHRVEQGRF